MRHLTKAQIIFIYGVVLLLWACSSTNPATTSAPLPESTIAATATPVPASKPTTRSIAPTPIPTAAPTPVGAPAGGKSGGSLTVAALADIPHRDVHQSVQETLASLGPGLAYSRLLRLRSGPGADHPNLLLECDLCSSWKLTSDFAYEFQLRTDVRWQDVSPVNGRLLTADDLVFSYERMLTPGWRNAFLFSSIGNIRATSPHTLRVRLASADADALLSLADGHTKIVAREVVEQYGDLRDSPVIGTGPWLWEGTETGIGTSFTRNFDYFEEGLPFLDNLAIKVIKSRAGSDPLAPVRLAALEAGIVDVALLTASEWREFNEAGANSTWATAGNPGGGVMFWMNVQTPALSKLAVRRAILRAMDPWDYIDTLWFGQGSVSLGIPVQHPKWLLSRKEMRTTYFGDPGAARELLAGSGLRGPVDIELTVRNDQIGPFYPALEKRVGDDLSRVGFKVTIRRLNPAQFDETVLAHKEYQVALGLLPPTSTTNSFLLALLHSGGRWNIVGHQDTVLDEMIERQAGEFDADLRGSLLGDLQRHVLDQAYLFSPTTGEARWAFSNNLKGFYPNAALSEYNYWSRVWLER